MVDQLFGVKLHTALKSEETGEEFKVGADTKSSLLCMGNAGGAAGAK
jgi:hypothetical protein